MKIIDRVIRILVGLFFIFSGIVKVNDPVGTSIKLKEYFEVFAQDFMELFRIFAPFSLEIAVFVIVLEVVLGVALVMSYQMKLASWIILGLIVFFTFLTFYSAVFDKVTDCGCFGDAIPLTPWASFYKDLILLALILYLFFRRNKFPSPQNRTGDVAMGIALAGSLFLSIYAIRHLPYIDFRPYHVGAHIPSYMKPSEPLRYQYIMEKDGKKRKFDVYPSDTSYTFKEMILLNPKAKPRITDYSVWNDEGDYTQATFEGRKLLAIVENIKKANRRGLEKIQRLAAAVEDGIEVMILTATDEPTFQEYRHEYQISIPFYFADATVLETMVRSNPGLIAMKDGKILAKWHHNDTPSPETVREILNGDQ